MHVLCLGTSYTGRYAASHFCDEHDIYFLSRSPNYYKSLLYWNRVFLGQVRIDCILDTIPPVGIDEGLSKQETLPSYHDSVIGVLKKNPLASYIHISSTSVFPTPDFSQSNCTHIVDETTHPIPNTKKGMIRLNWEKKICELYPFCKIVRSTGIYGPKRSLLEQFQNKNYSRAHIGNRYTSRIHVHDLLRLAFALAESPSDLSLVHGVDQKVAPYAEVFSFLEREWGFSIPGNWRHAPPTGRIVKSLYAEKLLRGKYLFPSYKDGFCRTKALK